MNKIFWYAKVSETLKGCTRIFLALWDQKLSTEKRESPLFIHETFWNQKFSQEEWDSLTKVFGTVRQKKFRIKPWCPVHSYPWKISIKEFFWNTKVFSIELLRYSETKTSTENDDTPPPFTNKKISLPESFWNTEWFPGEVFSVLWDKNFFDKIVKLPPPLLETLRCQNSFETQKGSLTDFIGTVRRRFFNGVEWYHLLMHKILIH